MDLRDYLGIIFRHFQLVMLVFVLTIVTYFSFFNTVPEERFVSEIELNISIAELTIQTSPDRFLIPNYTNQQLLQVILRSDSYYKELADTLGEQYDKFQGEAGPKQLRHILQYSFSGASPQVQITTLNIQVETGMQQESDEVLQFAVAVFKKQLQEKTESKTQNEIISVRQVRKKVEEQFQTKLTELQETREQQKSNSVEIQINASQSRLVTISTNISEKRYEIDAMLRRLKTTEGRLLEGSGSGFVGDEDTEIVKWEATIKDLRYEFNFQSRTLSEGHPDLAALEHKLMEAERSLREAQYTAGSRAMNRLRRDRDELAETVAFEQNTYSAMQLERNALLEDVKTLVGKRNAIQDLEEETSEIQSMISELTRHETNLNVQKGKRDMFVHTVSYVPAHTVVHLQKPLQRLLLVLIVAMIVATFAAYIRELLSVDIENEQDIRRYLGLPVIMRVPRIRRGEETIMTRIGPTEWFAELFKNMALIVASSMNQRKYNVIEITSTGQQEGKSTIAINLAVSLARLEHSVLLLDCDLRAPAVHRMLKLQNKGIAEYVKDCMEQSTFLDVHSHMQQTAELNNLDILTAGKDAANPIQLLRSSYFRQMIATMRDQYDYIVIDTPPVSYAAEGLLLADMADNVYMVVAQSETNKKMSQEAVSMIRNAGTEITGILFNKSRHHMLGGNYYYRYYGHYGYGSKRS